MTNKAVFTPGWCCRFILNRHGPPFYLILINVVAAKWGYSNGMAPISQLTDFSWGGIASPEYIHYPIDPHLTLNRDKAIL